MDHVITVILVFLYPAWAGYRFRQVRFERKPRERAYLESAAGLWSLVVIVILYMTLTGRDLADIGLIVTFDWRNMLTLLLGSAAVLFLVQQAFMLTRNDEAQQVVLRQTRRILPIIPRNLRQLVGFALLAVTAGICEEVLFRGYLIDYLTRHSDSLTAFFASAILFGLAHAYQGPRGVLQGLAAGLIFAALFFFTGSLLVPVVLHIAVDLHGGWVSYYVIRKKAF